jgi:hypothetical protein
LDTVWTRDDPKAVSTARRARLSLPGDTFEANKDDEIERWLELGYVEQVKSPRRKDTRKK